MNRSAFAAALAALLTAGLSAHAETLKGYVYAALEEDGAVEINTTGANSQNYTLNLPSNKLEQWAKLDGGLVILQGTFQKDGSFTPDLKAPIVLQATAAASSGKKANLLDTQAPSRGVNNDGAIKVKFTQSAGIPKVGELIWATGKFNGATYGMNI